MSDNYSKLPKRPNVENGGGHKSWNFNPKLKGNRGLNSASKQSFGKGRKKV